MKVYDIIHETTNVQILERIVNLMVLDGKYEVTIRKLDKVRIKLLLECKNKKKLN